MSTVLIVAGLTLVGLFALVIGLQFYMIRKMQANRGQPAPELQGEMGEWLAQGKAGLFYFFSPQCGACRAMTPVVKRLAQERGGVFPVDVSKDLSTARSFGVMATPTVVVVRDAKVDQILIGAQSEAVLSGLI
ncbi:MAG: thioredoxin family protein [Deltaproteobacteria bacterium]|nr:thioredoxin family protein [Deltaproteobacteria bacterium]